MHWYLGVLKKYAVFEGRAHRSEYWYFVLFSLIVTVVLTICDAVIRNIMGITIGILGNLYGLAVLIPSIAVGVRRLHDTNRSGWWMLLALVPIAGLVLIWFLAQDSEPATNPYGTNPKLAVA